MFPRLCLAFLVLVALASPSLAQGKGGNGPGRSEHAPGHGGTPPGHGGTPPGQVDRDNAGKSDSGSVSASQGPSNTAPVTPTPATTSDTRPSSNAPGSSGSNASGNASSNHTATSPASPSVSGTGTSAAGATSAALSAAPAISAPARQPVAAIDTLSADQVRSAVENRQALPLSSFSDAIRERGGGNMVDANLLRVDNMLVYAIKVLNPAGRLTIEYFHARSGVYIGSE